MAGAHGALRVRVLIRPKSGILDPAGQAVERALPVLGFEAARNVHVGRLVELDVDWGQGFHFGRPQPLVDVAAAVANAGPARGRRIAGS